MKSAKYAPECLYYTSRLQNLSANTTLNELAIQMDDTRKTTK